MSIDHFGYVSEWRNPHALLIHAKAGDLIEFDRGTYKHWAVYTGHGSVAHLVDPTFKQRTSALLNTVNAEVSVQGFLDVAEEDACRINNSLDHRFTPFRSEQIVDRATTAQGPQDYNLRQLNCEHFATWARYGRFISDQVERAFDVGRLTAIGVIGGMAAVGAVAVIQRLRQT